MSAQAQVIAIGKFSPDIAPALEYGAERYAGVPVGAIVASNVFFAEHTTGSRSLAGAFGVSLTDLGRHHLDPNAANIAVLREEYGASEVEKYLALVRAGFQFYLLPNA